MAVQGQKSFTREFFIPSDAPLGTYMVGVEVLYSTTVATASQMLSLVEPKEETAKEEQVLERNRQVIMLLTAALITVVIGMLIIFKGQKGPRFYRRERQ